MEHFHDPKGIHTKDSISAMSVHEKERLLLQWKDVDVINSKLKAVSRTSALLAGFAIVTLVEITLPERLPLPLLCVYGAMTVLLITVHLMALLLSICIAPHVQPLKELHFLSARPQSVDILQRMRFYISLSWILSTAVGIVLFFSELLVIIWIKLMYTQEEKPYFPALLSSLLIIPVVAVALVFGVQFYRSLIKHTYNTNASKLQELETLLNDLNSAHLNVQSAVPHIPSQRALNSNINNDIGANMV